MNSDGPPSPGLGTGVDQFPFFPHPRRARNRRLGGDDRKPECVARVAPADEVDIIHVLSWSEWRSVGQEGQEERGSFSSLFVHLP